MSQTTNRDLSSCKALVFAFLSGMCFSTNSVLVRLESNVNPSQMAIYRFLGSVLFSVPIVIHSNNDPLGPKAVRLKLTYRAISACLTVIFSFVSFRYLPIGEASVIVFSTPVFVTMFARVFLKEPCGLIQSVIVGLTVIGIVFVIDPTSIATKPNLFLSDHLIGVSAGMAGLLSQCAMVIFTRQTRNAHYSVVCFTSTAPSLVGCVFVTLATGGFVLSGCQLRRWSPIAMGAFSTAGQILYIKALQLENVGPVATVKAASEITIAVAWQILVFKEQLSALAASGTVLVTLGVLLIGLRKWVLMFPDDSPMKKRMKCLIY